MPGFSCRGVEERVGLKGRCFTQGTFRIVPVLLVFALTQCGCRENPATSQKLKEERWRKGRVFAELQILKARRPILPGWKVDDEVDFATYRQSQARTITSLYVLHAAYRQPEIATLSILKEQEHPLEWLERNIEVTHPAEEFIRVSLETDQRSDAAAIINAVVEAYLQEVADAETGSRNKRRRELEEAREDLVSRRKIKQARYRRFAEEVGAMSEMTLNHAELAMVQFYAMVRDELAREEFARSRDNMELMFLKNSRAERAHSVGSEAGLAVTPEMIEAEVGRLESSLRDRGARIAEWQRMLEHQASHRKSPGGQSLELESLQRELVNEQKILDQINEAILRIELEQDLEPRVRLFRRAES